MNYCPTQRPTFAQRTRAQQVLDGWKQCKHKWTCYCFEHRKLLELCARGAELSQGQFSTLEPLLQRGDS